MKKLLTILALALSTLSFSHAQQNLSQGGTGWNTSTTGDLFTGTTSNLRYTRLPIGSTGNVLWVNGGKPAWVATSSLGFPTSITYTGTYPIIVTGSVISTGFSTSTVNVFSQNQTINANLTVTGTTALGNTTISNATSSVHVFNTSAWFKGLVGDSTNATGTYGNVFISTGTSTLWVATSSLGFLPFASSSLYVPYTGATGKVDLGSQTFTSTGLFTSTTSVFTNASTTNLTVSTKAFLNVASTTGGLTVSGFTYLATSTASQLGISTTTFSTGNTVERLKIDCGALTENCVNVFSTANDFSQIISGNYGTGINTQAGFTAQNASSTATTNYMWLGKNGTQFGTTNTYSSGFSNDGTIINSGNSLQIANTATGTANLINFITGGVATSSVRLSINGGGQVAIATTSVPTYGFTVSTTTQITGTAYVKYLYSNVVGYASAASTTVNLDDLGNGGTATSTIFATTTLVNPTGTCPDENMYQFRLRATTTQGLYWGTLFASSTGLNLPNQIASGTTRYLFACNQNTGKIDFVASQGVFIN